MWHSWTFFKHTDCKMSFKCKLTLKLGFTAPVQDSILRYCSLGLMKVLTIHSVFLLCICRAYANGSPDFLITKVQCYCDFQVIKLNSETAVGVPLSYNTSIILWRCTRVQKVRHCWRRLPYHTRPWTAYQKAPWKKKSSARPCEVGARETQWNIWNRLSLHALMETVMKSFIF